MTFRRERYAADWPAIRRAILERAFHRCECTGECGDAHPGECCGVPDRCRIRRRIDAPATWVLVGEAERSGLMLGPVTVVVLTIAHLDHDETNNDHGNLRALCQRCHLQHDRSDNAHRARDARVARSGQGSLF